MAELTEENKRKFLAAANDLQDSAYRMLELWEGPMQGYLDENKAILKAYPFKGSFDEWFHEMMNYTETLSHEFKKDDADNFFEKQIREGSSQIRIGMEEGNIEYADRLRGLLDAVLKLDATEMPGAIERIKDGIEADQAEELGRNE